MADFDFSGRGAVYLGRIAVERCQFPTGFPFFQSGGYGFVLVGETALACGGWLYDVHTLEYGRECRSRTLSRRALHREYLHRWAMP